jgi:hypothetical protein
MDGIADAPRAARMSSNKFFLVIILVVITALIVDTTITRTSVFLSSDLFSSWRNFVFVIIVGVFVAGHYVISRYVQSRSKEAGVKERLRLDVIYKGVVAAQFVLIAVLLLISFQMVTDSSYNTVLLAAITAISYALAAIILGILSRRFFMWFQSNHNSVVLFYGLASALLVINVVITLIFAVLILQDKPSLIVPRIGIQIPIAEPGSGSVKDILNQAYLISSIASFIMIWTATVFLLHHHSKKIGKITYWIIVTIPLAYFLSQFVSLFIRTLDPLIEISPVSVSILLVLVFWLSKPAGGILFGVAFWRMTKSVDSRIVKDYLIISAYGLILFFFSNQAIPIVASPTFPPFGFVTISFLGLASYLLLVGIYSSATSVSQDAKLRASIKKYAFNELKLLDSISSAELEDRLEKGVKNIIKMNRDSMVEETGVQSSLSEDNVKQYLDEVLKESKKRREEKEK